LARGSAAYLKNSNRMSEADKQAYEAARQNVALQQQNLREAQANKNQADARVAALRNQTGNSATRESNRLNYFDGNVNNAYNRAINAGISSATSTGKSDYATQL